MSELTQEVTQIISKMMELKLAKLTDTLDRIVSSLECQSKRITEAERRISAVDDQVAALEVRLAQVENK